MNKYDVLKRSQILMAIHQTEQDLASEPRQSKRFMKLHGEVTQLYAALQRKDTALLEKWHRSPIIEV